MLREDDKPSKLDIIFTKNLGLDEGVSHGCPLEENDHELLEMKILEGYEYREEAYKERRRNYAEADYVGLKTFFAGVDWVEWTDIKRSTDIQDFTDMKKSTNVQVKYDTY